MTRERWARVAVGALALGLAVAALAGRWANGGGVVEIHARMAEAGGWTPSEITATVGEPLRLRLTSDDVTHSFAIGQSDRPVLDVRPGEMTKTTLVFDRPGKYTFYCTRWCGLNHWRMRGTIEVRGVGTPAPRPVPRYVALGLDLDASHAARVVPERRPSATRGATLAAAAPALAATDLRAVSPATLWDTLRRTSPAAWSDADVWDAVAFAWTSSRPPASIEEGRRLYAANCAACHGEAGDGHGVMAGSLRASLAPRTAPSHMAAPTGPADFTNPARMLGASSVLLEGKIVRGGMGTGMPYWGPIFTDAQVAALVDFLWTFQFSDTSSVLPGHSETTPHHH